MDRGGAARQIVVMGASGAGKSTVGMAIARRLGCTFLDGDDLHPPANVAKMRAGFPLDDADRWPWLDAIAAWIAARARQGGCAVVACSALRHAYRDRLRSRGGAGILFVLLDPGAAALRSRLAARTGHFMPPSLLASQLETLERPAPDESAIVVEGGADAEETSRMVIAELRRRGLLA